MNNSDYTNASSLINGYFYTFTYDPRKPVKQLVDYTPYIFCIGPVGNAQSNLFTGLNLHHISIKDREKLLREMQIHYQFMDNEKEHIISEYSLNQLVPGVSFGIRVYNMKRMYDIKRVNNSAAALYIYDQGDISLASPNDKFVKYLINNKYYKTSKATA